MRNHRNGNIGRAPCQFPFLWNHWNLAGICGALIRPPGGPENVYFLTIALLQYLLDCNVEKWGGDARTEGKQAYIGGGTVSKSVYRKEKMGAPKKPPTYLHIQIESGAHRVGQTPENVNM